MNFAVGEIVYLSFISTGLNTYQENSIWYIFNSNLILPHFSQILRIGMYIYFPMTKHLKLKNLVKYLLKKCLWKAFIVFWIVKSISHKMSIFHLLSVFFSLNNFKHVSIYFNQTSYLFKFCFVKGYITKNICISNIFL